MSKLTEGQVREVLDDVAGASNVNTSGDAIAFSCNDFDYRINKSLIEYKNQNGINEQWYKWTHEKYAEQYNIEEIDLAVNKLASLLTQEPEQSLEQKVRELAHEDDTVLKVVNGTVVIYNSLENCDVEISSYTIGFKYSIDSRRDMTYQTALYRNDKTLSERGGSYVAISDLLREQETPPDPSAQRIAELEREIEGLRSDVKSAEYSFETEQKKREELEEKLKAKDECYCDLHSQLHSKIREQEKLSGEWRQANHELESRLSICHLTIEQLTRTLHQERENREDTPF